MSAHDNPRSTHESYGLIEISRTQCSPPMTLFGSPVKTSNPICLRIHTAYIHNPNTADEYYHPQGQLIEVDLSPAQYAELITTMNIGSGTPCTIKWVTGDKNQRREKCPEHHPLEAVNNEVKATMKNVTDSIEKLKTIAQNVLDQKGNIPQASRKELLGQINNVLMQLQQNVPYVHEKVTEAIQDTLQKAKAEISATLSTASDKMLKAGMTPPEFPQLT